MLEAAQLRIGFSTAIDGRIEKIVENLGEVKPTFVAAVPRIFEKVHNKVVAGAKEAGGAKWAIFKWAFGVGREVSKLRQAGQEPAGLLALKHSVADTLVFSKLHTRFGGPPALLHLRAAPRSPGVGEFFHAAGILILEGYGLTETSAATFVNPPGSSASARSGRRCPGTEVKIAEDGEILIKGRGVMRGYHNLPEQTAETLDADGWLHTGDIGDVEDGFLRITDRKKDLIKTSGGKYVAPQRSRGSSRSSAPTSARCSSTATTGTSARAGRARPRGDQKWAAATVSAGSLTPKIVAPGKSRPHRPFIDEVN